MSKEFSRMQKLAGVQLNENNDRVIKLLQQTLTVAREDLKKSEQAGAPTEDLKKIRKDIKRIVDLIKELTEEDSKIT
jgi:2-phosphoglycerate kinase